MQTDLDTFKRVLNVAPNYLKYNRTLTATEWAVNRFWEDSLAGDSILKPTRIKFSRDLIPNPMNSLLASALDESMKERKEIPPLQFVKFENVMQKEYAG